MKWGKHHAKKNERQPRRYGEHGETAHGENHVINTHSFINNAKFLFHPEVIAYQK